VHPNALINAAQFGSNFALSQADGVTGITGGACELTAAHSGGLEPKFARNMIYCIFLELL
jgi:hypothetical protein